MKLAILLSVFGLSAQAMPIKSQMIKPRAYYQEADNNMLEALDLKSKTLTFVKSDFDLCGTKLMRKGQTLIFSCTLPIPTNARISKLQTLKSPKTKEIAFGATKRTVMTVVSDDARSITFSTAFDATGIDFEVMKFNEDFNAIYATTAQKVIADALKIQPVQYEVLESR